MDHARYEREVGRSVEPKPGRMCEPGRRAWLDSLKTGVPCADCGRSFPHQVMQWDHRPGTEKLLEISTGFGKWTREAILAEIAKCDLVCTNCHMIRTFSRAEWGRKWLREDAA